MPTGTTDRYWVGGSGTWDASSTTHWSASSGGAGGASVPTSTTNVHFDQAGTYTVTFTTGALVCADFIVAAGTVTFSGTSTGTMSVYGSLSFVAGTIFSATLSTSSDFRFQSNTAATIQTNGTVFTNMGFNFASTGPFTFLNSVTAKGLFMFGNSTLNFSNNTFTNTNTGTNTFLSGTINWGSSGTGALINPTSSSYSVYTFSTSGVGEIRYVNTSSITLNSSSLSLSGTTFTFAAASTNLAIAFGSTATSLSLEGISNPGYSSGQLSITAGKTVTVNTFNYSGNAASKSLIRSVTAGSAATLSKSSGSIVCNYLDIKDSTATGGATWTAYNSINNGNNTGWTISATGPSTSVTVGGVSATGLCTTSVDVGIGATINNLAGVYGTGYVANVDTFIGYGVVAGVNGVYGTGYIGNVSIPVSQNITVIVYGVAGEGVVNSLPLNSWVTIDTSQTANWVPVST